MSQSSDSLFTELWKLIHIKVRACADLIIQFADEDVLASNVGGGGGQLCPVLLDCGLEHRLFLQDPPLGYLPTMSTTEKCLVLMII